MSELDNFITSCTFKGKEYMIKMNIQNNKSLEMTLTKKHSGELWKCSFDAQEIENLTHRTGNFKSFHTFITMLKSGMLKTSDSVHLDLLSLNDLELMRNRRILNPSSWTHLDNYEDNTNNNNQNKHQRKYLILTYSVEFDRIHYPLSLEYCGLPSAQILQTTIKRLENEVARLQEQLQRVDSRSNDKSNQKIKHLEKQVNDLRKKNDTLKERLRNGEGNQRSVKNQSQEQRHLSCSARCNHLNETMETLEHLVRNERTTFGRVVKKLKEENRQLMQQIEELRSSESVMAARIRHQQDLIKRHEQHHSAHSRCSSREKDLKKLKTINKCPQGARSDSSSPQRSHSSGSKRKHILKSKFTLNEKCFMDCTSGGGGDLKKPPAMAALTPNKKRSSSRETCRSSASTTTLSSQTSGSHRHKRHTSSDQSKQSPTRRRKKYPRKHSTQDKKSLIIDLESRIEALQRLIQQGFTI